MRTRAIVAEVVAWSLFCPVALILTARRLLGYGRGTAAERVDALLAWYPAEWRERHGAELAQLLHDAIDHGRGDLRMAVDVAREGLLERLRALCWNRVRASLLLTVGWIMVLPQGIVAAVLSQFEALPPSWFVALHVGGDELWLVAGAMVGVGLVLVDRGLHALAEDCKRRKQHAAR